MTTALTELIEWIVKDILTNPEYKDCPQLKLGARTVKVKAEKLLEKEKQQIVAAHRKALRGITTNEKYCDDSAEQYYKENFE